MSQTEPGRTPPRRTVEAGERHTAPFRRPTLSRQTLATAALYLGGAVFATGVPALIVPPNSQGDSAGRLLTAYALTVVGVVVMVVACLLAYRRARDRGVLVMAVVPTGVILAGGLMLLGTKLFD